MNKGNRLCVVGLLLLSLPSALSAQRNCKKGIQCGGSCISATKTCRVGTPPQPATRDLRQRSDSGPSLAETAAWLASEGPGLAGDVETHLDTARTLLLITTHRVSGFGLAGCVLGYSVLDSAELRSRGAAAQIIKSRWTDSVPLRYVDITGTRVDENPVSELNDEPAQHIVIKMLASAGKAVRQYDAKGLDSATAGGLYARSAADGARVVAAIKRAAALCGAKASVF